MDNTLIIGGNIIHQEKIWRIKKNDKSRDSKGKPYPYPTKGKIKIQPNIFMNRLTMLHEALDIVNYYNLYYPPRDCLLCNKKNISTKTYVYKNVMWEDGLLHYINEHNIEPSFDFKKFVFRRNIFNKIKKNMSRSKNNNIKHVMILKKIIKNRDEFVVLKKNNLLILDALMIHGGYKKKYIDKLDKNIERYSEHAGMLDFAGNTIHKIVVSAKTTRVDDEDNEIYMPNNIDDMLKYEYIFHTHPPTPSPGGRAKDGILLEIPSIGDLFHFIEHHNEGNVIGSLVVAAEGLYNIRKLVNDGKDIIISENDMYDDFQKHFYALQKKAIKKYGTRFTNNTFYSKIAQDVTFIKKLNKILNKYELTIDYYPRSKGKNKEWYIDTVFLEFRRNKK